MKLFLLLLLCIVMTNEISAQGVTINGRSTGASTTFVSRNSKIGSGLVLDRNGKVYVLASIFPTSAPPICFNSIPETLTATGDGGTGLYTYQWFMASGDSIPGATDQTYIPANINETASKGYYCAITSGAYGTKNTSTTTVTVIAQAAITAGGGGTFPAGSDVTLTSSGTNVMNQYWQGPKGYFSVAKDPVLNNITLAMDSTYTVTGNSLSGINLVTNGDFEAGVAGFASGYVNNQADLHTEGEYAVISDPHAVHGDWTYCPNHTISGSLEMVINGAITANVNVWSEEVNVVPGTDYQFTYWVQSVFNGNPSRLQLWVNGKPAGPVYTAIAQTCQWIQFNYNWSAGPGVTTAILSLTNQNIIANGNDFALDDIVFQQVCNSKSSVVVKVQ